METRLLQEDPVFFFSSFNSIGKYQYWRLRPDSRRPASNTVLRPLKRRKSMLSA
jgi:hypothetical protein